MNQVQKILNDASEDVKLGKTINLTDLSISQLSQIKTTARTEQHWLKVSIFVFEDDSYLIVEQNTI